MIRLRFAALYGEAFVSAVAQPVASLVSVVVVVAMCATVILTTGRTVGAEEDVLGSIDSAGTRSIVIRADADAGLDSTVLERLASIDGIEWSGVFGPARDSRNAAIPDGEKVPIRLFWGDPVALGANEDSPSPGRTAWASAAALQQLGMPQGAGAVIGVDGEDYAIAGEIPVPDYLSFLEPLVVVPQLSDGMTSGDASILVVIAERPDLVAPVSAAVQSVLGVQDPTKVKITTSESLAELRSLVQGQLGTYGRGLVIVILSVTAILVGAIQYALVMLRRKDFGRRRALGASRALVVSLVLAQTSILAGAGALLGITGGVLGLVATGDPLPGPGFLISVGILAVAVSVTSALLPAIAAARRDPLRELRVP